MRRRVDKSKAEKEVIELYGYTLFKVKKEKSKEVDRCDTSGAAVTQEPSKVVSAAEAIENLYRMGGGIR